MLKLQSALSVVGGQHQQAYLVGQAEGDPLVAAAVQGGRRAGLVGDAPVAAAED
jgi:hypothetical protein